MSRSLPNRALHVVFSKVNQKRPWWQLPTTSLKVLNLLSLRLDLRDLNLFDTGTPIRKHGLEDPPPEALLSPVPDSVSVPHAASLPAWPFKGVAVRT